MKIYSHGLGRRPNGSTDGCRLVATSEQPIHGGFSVKLLDRDHRSLVGRIATVGQVGGPHYLADYHEESDLRYGLLACAYHLERIALLYREIVTRFEERAPDALRGNTHAPMIYFEIDAFLGVSRRWYETLRVLVWKHYGTGTRPESFRKLLTAETRLPNSYANQLAQSWAEVGDRLSEYRNSAVHYAPLNNGLRTCWAERWGEDWGVTVRLPSNPGEQSRRLYDFEHGPDALNYCHDVLCHLVDLAHATETLREIRSYLDAPTR